MKTIGITGSEGLIGSALRPALEELGYSVACLDVRLPPTEGGSGDVCDLAAVRRLVSRCAGVVHLAAISRVVWGQLDPRRCLATNVGGTANVLRAATEARHRPWVLFTSSREVYGEPTDLPVGEDAPLRPVNVYGESKVAAERAVSAARSSGLVTGIVRLSNVYGSTRDHADRVVPAFARAAVLGSPLRVDGAHNTFDFTHIDDTCRGLVRLVEMLGTRQLVLPPVHLLTGTPTTLGQLAALAVRLAGMRSPVVEAPPRSYDVSQFYGSPTRAAELLGWTPQVPLMDGLGRLIADLKLEMDAVSHSEVAP